MSDEIKIARLETLLYNSLTLLRELYGWNEDDFTGYLKENIGLNKVEYDRLMKGESIC